MRKTSPSKDYLRFHCAAEHLFGQGSVLSVATMNSLRTENTNLPLTADQLKIKCFSDHQKKYGEAAEREGVRQKFAKEQKGLLKAARA